MGCAICQYSEDKKGNVFVIQDSTNESSRKENINNIFRENSNNESNSEKTKSKSKNYYNFINTNQQNNIANNNNINNSDNNINYTNKYSNLMLNEINFARTNPIKYISKIEKYKKNIINRNGQFFLQIENNISLLLNKGIESFNNCIEFLKKQEKLKLEPLIMKEELIVPFPNNSPQICVTRDYLQNILLYKNAEISTKYKIIDFHYDLSIPNVEISTLMQIIDDTNKNYQRRKNIFNQKAKYIGISCGSYQGIFCFYLMFSE